MKWKLPSETKIFPFLLIVAIILLANPIIINLNKNANSLMSDESYFHLRMIEQYRNSDVYNKDVLLDRNESFNLFYYLAAKSNIPIAFILNILPVILGVLAFLLFYSILKQGEFENNTLLYSAIILISSPLYIYTFSTLNPESFYIVIFLTSILLYLKNNPLSILFSALMAFLNVPFFIVLSIFFFIHKLSFSYMKMQSKYWWANIISGLAAIGIYYYFIGVPDIFSQAFLNTSISELFITTGGIKGYSIIFIVLAATGLFAFWKRSFYRLLMYLLVAALFVASFYYIPLRILFIFMIVVFSGKALSNLVSRHWKLAALKDVTILIIICIILFSTIVFTTSQIGFASDQKLEGINFLSSVRANKVIFSHEENGFMIQEVQKRKTFLDSKSIFYDDYESRTRTSNILYYSRDLVQIEEELQKNNIDHIFVSKDMFNGLVWNSPDDGALFIYKNSKKFIKVFENEEVTIYRYISRKTND